MVHHFIIIKLIVLKVIFISDSIYTERYMGLPTVADNIEGYRNTDTIRNVEALRNKTFFLIHGNADDNVHYQQSMLLSKVLERSDIMFYQQVRVVHLY